MQLYCRLAIKNSVLDSKVCSCLGLSDGKRLVLGRTHKPKIVNESLHSDIVPEIFWKKLIFKPFDTDSVPERFFGKKIFFKQFDTLMVFLKDFLEKLILKKVSSLLQPTWHLVHLAHSSRFTLLSVKM